MPDFERPDREEIDARRKYLEIDVWGATNANWRTVDRFYHRTYDVWTGPNAAADKENRGEYRPSTSTNIVDHASDQFMGSVPTVHREPVGQGDKHKSDADDAEVAMKNVMQDSIKRAMTDPFRRLNKHLNVFGYGILELAVELEDMRRLRQNPAYWNPIRILAPHPARVLMDPLEKIPREALKITVMRSGRLKDLLKSKSNLTHFDKDAANEISNKKSHEELELEHDWTMEAHTLKRKGGKILFAEKNVWKFIPFMQSFAGYGMEPTDLAKNDPQYEAVGLLQPVMESIRAEAQMATAKRYAVIDNIYAPYVARNREAMMRALQTGEIAPGDVLDYGKMNLGGATRDIFDAGREAQDDIARGTFQPSISGQRTGGVVTVGQQQILDHSALKKFSGPSIQIEHMASIAAGWIARLVDTMIQLKDGIGAHGKLLRRSDLHGVYDFLVTFESLDPVLQMQIRDLIMREYELGLASDEDYWQFGARITNVKQRRERLTQQRIRRHPAMDEQIIRAQAQAMQDVPEEAVEQIAAAAANKEVPFTPEQGTPEVARDLRQPLADDVAKPARLDNLGPAIGGQPQ